MARKRKKDSPREAKAAAVAGDGTVAATAPAAPERPPATAPDASRRAPLRNGPFIAILALAAIGVFADSLGNGFVYDDVQVIAENTRLDHPLDLGTFFGTPYWQDERGGQDLYRPLTLLSLAVDRAVFGTGPVGVHLVNVVLNAAVAILAFLYLLSLLGRRDVAFVAALLFALHPIHTEVVANGVGRSELGAAAALLGALWLLLRNVRPRADGGASTRATKRRGTAPPYAGRALLVAAGVLYFVALGFKESAVVMPALALLAEWLIVRRGAWPRRLLPYFAMGAPLAVFLALRARVVGWGTPAIQEVMAGITAGQRMLHASETTLRYVGQLLFPWRLCAEYSDYTHLVRPKLTEPMVLLSLLAWAGLAMATWALARRRAFDAVFGIAWFVTALLPTSNLVFATGTVRAERLLYVPSLGFVLLLALGWARLAAWHRVVANGLLALVVAFYGWRTATRNLDWRSQESLWTATIAQNPGSSIGWSFLGDIAEAKGKDVEAEADYKRAYELSEEAGFFYAEAHDHYAALLLKRGDRKGAEEHYRLVVTKKPQQFTALTNLGELLLHDPASIDEAVGFLRRASEVKPGDFMPHANMAQAFKSTGRFDEALASVERAIALRQGDPDLWELKAEILEHLGRAPDAAAATREAARLRGGR